MKDIVWELASKLSDNSQIDKLNARIVGILPSDYISCVLYNNAGYPSLNVFETQLGTQHIFNNLLSLDESDDENVFKVYQFISEETDRKDILPFARDSFGNYICFDYREIPVSVVFWNHETNSLDAVAKTFTDLINMLHKSE